MKMSDGEKLISLMLADLMKHLAVEGEIDPDFVQDIVAGNDLWALKWKYGGIFHDEGPTDEVVNETTQIMTMCRNLEQSINQLGPNESSQITASDQVVFDGFDGNYEPHYGVAKMLVHKLDCFEEWVNRPLNSHTARLENYRRMLKRYEKVAISARGKLSLGDIQKILYG